MHAIEVDEATFATLKQYAETHAVAVQDLIVQFATTLREKSSRSFVKDDAGLDEALRESFPAGEPPELAGGA